MGAVMYRLVSLSAQQFELGLTQRARWVQKILDWFPVRVLGFVFALVGHFTAVFAVWRKNFFTSLRENDATLADCGIAALATPSQRLPEDGSLEKNALALFDRALIISLVISAMMILIVL